MAYSLQHSAHLTVPAFRNRDAVPAIGTFPTALFDAAKLGTAIVQRHAIQQPLLFFFGQCAQHPHRVLALQPKARMHQTVSQLARAGEQQQAFGIQVQTPNRLPLALVQLGQTAEHRGPVLRIILGHHFAGRLVVRNHPRRRSLNAHLDRLAIDLDLISELNALADVGRLVVDRDAPFGDKLLHLQPRA